jgi:hypothetical protein
VTKIAVSNQWTLIGLIGPIILAGLIGRAVTAQPTQRTARNSSARLFGCFGNCGLRTPNRELTTDNCFIFLAAR